MANQNRRELLMIQPVGKMLVNSFIFYAQLNYDDVYMSIWNKGVDSRDRDASFKYSIKTVYIFSQAIRKTLFTFIKISFRRYFLRSWSFDLLCLKMFHDRYFSSIKSI